MIEKLEWKEGAVELMEYIKILESLYIPFIDEYEYNTNIETRHLTDSEEDKARIEKIRNLPFGATDTLITFKDRYNKNGIKLKRKYTEFMQKFGGQYWFL